jgi:hypothetical protein
MGSVLTGYLECPDGGGGHDDGVVHGGDVVDDGGDVEAEAMP